MQTAGPESDQWTKIHPDNWTADDITAWGNHVADENNMSPSLRRALVISLCRFSGRQLLRMTTDDFKRNFPEFQNTLYPAMENTFSTHSVQQAVPSTSSPKDRRYFRSISDSEISKRKVEHERHRLRWTHIHPDHWSSVEVASWLNFVADEHGFTHEERTSMLESFESTTGPQLSRMSRDDFLATDPAKGGIIFEVFKGVYPAGFQATLEEVPGNKGSLLPPVTEDSSSVSSLEPSPAVRRKRDSL